MQKKIIPFTDDELKLLNVIAEQYGETITRSIKRCLEHGITYQSKKLKKERGLDLFAKALGIFDSTTPQQDYFVASKKELQESREEFEAKCKIASVKW